MRYALTLPLLLDHLRWGSLRQATPALWRSDRSPVTLQVHNMLLRTVGCEAQCPGEPQWAFFAKVLLASSLPADLAGADGWPPHRKDELGRRELPALKPYDNYSAGNVLNKL